MKRLPGLLALTCLAAPCVSQAFDAYVTADISLQAGPAMQYPSLDELGAGTPVSVQGCIEAFSWCDVIAPGDERGWVAGSFLESDFSGQRVYIIDYGPRIGIPVVTFSLGAYWDAHYRNRPFFAERTTWEQRRIQPKAPPRPASSTPTEQRRTTNARTSEPAKTPQTTTPQNTTPSAQPQQRTNPTAPTAVEQQRMQPRTPPATPPQPSTSAEPQGERAQPPERSGNLEKPHKPMAAPPPKVEKQPPPRKDEDKKDKDKDKDGGPSSKPLE